MPHGMQDWAWFGAKETVYILQDMAELAVRLGSPVTYDRRGDLFWMTQFRHGLGGIEYFGVGAGYDVMPLAHPVKSNGLSIGMQPGPNVGDSVFVLRTLGLPSVSAIGNEFSFCFNSEMSNIYNEVLYYTGSQELFFAVRYTHATGVLDILNSAGGWTVIGTPGVQPTLQNPWITWKLVVDLQTGLYARVLFNQERYVPNTVGCQVSPSASELVLKIQAATYRGTGSTTGYVPVGDWLCTQNEPVQR